VPVEASATLRSGLVSALTFSATTSPVTSDDVYNGENYDFRLEQPGFSSCGFTPLAPWLASVAQPDPRKTAVLSWHSVQIAVDRDYSVAAITQPPAAQGGWVLDFSQNMAGIFTLNVICPDGAQWIYLHFGESLHPDGTVLNQYGGIMNSNITCAGTGDVETYRTLFSYYGFRYVQITNFPGVPDEGTMLAHFIHSDVEQVGGFSTSNGLLNTVQHCTRFASLSNLMDVPTDCPQRERRGWCVCLGWARRRRRRGRGEGERHGKARA
jgi:alpha-L-rhamnosidase